MGADFILFVLPNANLTPTRIAELVQLIEELPETELPETFDESPRQSLKEALDDYLVGKGGREAVVLNFEGWQYPMLFSGGMSWGDSPTELGSSMLPLIECDAIWNRLEAWARTDNAEKLQYRTNAIQVHGGGESFTAREARTVRVACPSAKAEENHDG